MMKALLLVFAPGVAWERILRVQRGLGFVLMAYLLPLLVLVSVGEGWSLANWGKWRGIVARPHLFPAGEVVIFEAVQILFSLLLVAFNATMIKTFGDTFHGRHTYTQSFTLAVYSLSPLFLLRLLGAFSHVPPLVVWVIGILLCLRALYPGVPRVMDPDPPHTFGLYLTIGMLMVLTTGLTHLVTTWFLQGKLTRLETSISDWGARLF